MVSYTRDELLSFRASGHVVPRTVRKTIFSLHLWIPKRQRDLDTTHAARADVNTSDSAPLAPSQPPSPKFSRGLITLACLNANSIRHRSAVLVDVIQQHNIDIFAITESKHEKHEDLSVRSLRPDGYRSLDEVFERMPVEWSTGRRNRSGPQGDLHPEKDTNRLRAYYF